MAEIRIRLFGGPEVTNAEGPVKLTPYQVLLVSLVAAFVPTGIPRSQVVRLLWEDSTTSRGRHRLRQLVHGVRTRLGPGALTSTGHDLLRLPKGASELEEWETLLQRGGLCQAAELLALGFLPGLGEPPVRAYADWLTGRRQALRTELQERASKSWDRCRDASQWVDGRDAAEALYLIDPSDEAHLRCILEARAMTGDLQAAEAALAHHRSLRAPGKSLHPSTSTLIERVRTLPRRSVQVARTTRNTSVPLVGRETVLGKLKKDLNSLRAGRVHMALVVGEGGIGKTRLLEELRRKAQLEGFRVLSASPVQVEQRLPLGTLADALVGPEIRMHLQGLAEPWRTLVTPFLPSHRGISTLSEVPPIQEGGLSRRLLDAFAFLIRAVVEEGPTLLALDDLQWADDTTLAVLQSLKRRWDGGKLAIVASARPPQERGRRWPSPYLNQFVTLADQRHHLEGLSPESARRLVQLTAGSPLPRETIERLVALGGGNPFFLIELTRDHISGRLPLTQAPGDPLPLPISLQELFEQRLDTLSPAARSVAEVLAIRARPISIAELADLAQASLEDTAEAMDELLRRRFVEVRKGRAAVSHELFRSAFYRQVSPARLAVRHLQVARHLLSRDAPSPHAELALHLARAGESKEAARHARLAAEQAVKRGAIVDATHLLRIVVDNEPDRTLRAEGAAELARLLHISRDMERAAPLLASAAAQLRSVGRRKQALRLDIRRVESMVEGAEVAVPEAIDHLTQIKAEARNEQDWVSVAMALDIQVHLLHQVGDMKGIQRIFSELRRCVRSGDREAECLANTSLAMSILFGDPAEGLSAGEEAVRIAEAEGFGQHLLKAQTRLIVVSLYLGRMGLESTQAVVAAARQRAVTSGDLGQRIMLEANLGSYFADEGHLELAERTYEEVARAFRRAEARVPKFNYLVNRASLARLKFEPERAQSFLNQARDLIVVDTPAYMLDTLEAEHGLVALQRGLIGEATERFHGLRNSEEGPLYFDPTSILTFRALFSRRMGGDRECLAHIRRVVDQLESRLTWPWLRSGLVECRLALKAGAFDHKRFSRFLARAEQLRLVGTVGMLQGLRSRA